MKNYILQWITTTQFLLILLNSTTQQAQQITEIDQYAAYLIERYEIPGMAIGVIDKGLLIHEGYYGTYDVENKIPADQHSLFNLHSLSKVFVNVAVFQLIEEGKMHLEDEIAKHLTDFPNHWGIVQIKHLLSHSSGIPNIIRYFEVDIATTKQKLYAAPSLFAPGSDFDYNQSNYWLLNRIINQLTKEGFDNTIRKQINDSFTSPLLFDTELENGTIQPKEYRPGPKGPLQMEYSEVLPFMNGAGGINITMKDFILWNINLNKNRLISPSSKASMWRAFTYNGLKHDFAHGWGIYNSNGTRSLGFSGGGVAGLRKFTDNDLTIIVLTNGYRYRLNVNTFINWIADHVREELVDLSAQLHKDLYHIFLQDNEDLALSNYATLRSQNQQVNMDLILNALGYELLAKEKFNQAITVFKLNTREHPKSWNAWDSLAEGYEGIGNNALAIQYYNKSLHLNSKNQHAINRLKMLSN